MDDRGIYRKYRIERTDGASKPGGKHHGCTYFVLDLECDPHAMAAILAYAVACESSRPGLAKNLRAVASFPSASHASCGCRGRAMCDHGSRFSPAEFLAGFNSATEGEDMGSEEEECLTAVNRATTPRVEYQIIIDNKACVFVSDNHATAREITEGLNDVMPDGWTCLVLEDGGFSIRVRREGE